MLTTRRRIVRLGLLAPLVALPLPAGTGAAGPPDPDLAARLAWFAEGLVERRDAVRFAVDGDRCLIVGDGWALAASRDGSGLTLRVEGLDLADERDATGFDVGVFDLLYPALQRARGGV